MSNFLRILFPRTKYMKINSHGLLIQGSYLKRLFLRIFAGKADMDNLKLGDKVCLNFLPKIEFTVILIKDIEIICVKNDGGQINSHISMLEPFVPPSRKGITRVS